MSNFKIVKKLPEKGYLIQECILTKQGENVVKDLQNSGMSDKGIASVLMPYDSTKKTQVQDTKLVSYVAQYYEGNL